MKLFFLLTSIGKNFSYFLIYLKQFPERVNSKLFLKKYISEKYMHSSSKKHKQTKNLLFDNFNANLTGNGVWKWEHYFDLYHHLFKKFRNKPVTILEIGIFSGGSLQLWRSYFGENCLIYGVDIDERCKAYSNGHTKIFIGNQQDRCFWKGFFEEVKSIDIIIDDGGHSYEQQRVTFEETLPFLSPGGVYICEDIHGVGNKFAEYSFNLIHQLNYFKSLKNNNLHSSDVNYFQSVIKSIHYLPFMIAIEKNEQPTKMLVAPKKGSIWQPFYEEKIKADLIK